MLPDGIRQQPKDPKNLFGDLFLEPDQPIVELDTLQGFNEEGRTAGAAPVDHTGKNPLAIGAHRDDEPLITDGDYLILQGAGLLSSPHEVRQGAADPSSQNGDLPSQASQPRTGAIFNLPGRTDLAGQPGNQAAQIGDLTASQVGKSGTPAAGRFQSFAAGAGHLGQIENLTDFGGIQDGALHTDPLKDRTHVHHAAEPQGLPRFKQIQTLAHHPELLANLPQVPGGGQPVKPLGSQWAIGKPGDDPLQVSKIQDIQVGNGHLNRRKFKTVNFASAEAACQQSGLEFLGPPQRTTE